MNCLHRTHVIYLAPNHPAASRNHLPMIDSATKDRILEAAHIVDVVSDFVTLRKRGFL